MKVGDAVFVSGYITKQKFIAGRTLAEIEKLLGFHNGRLSQGIIVVALNQLPAVQDVELGAYSNIAAHRLESPVGLDVDKLKSEAMKTWSIAGFERLVKVLANVRHDPDMHPDVQYPPGHGVPQWNLTKQVLGKVVAVVEGYPNGRFTVAR